MRWGLLYGGRASSRVQWSGVLTWPCPASGRHIFLGFSKCGRYVLSYTSSSGDDDFSFYIYHLYWWEFNVHSKLKLVRPRQATALQAEPQALPGVEHPRRFGWIMCSCQMGTRHLVQLSMESLCCLGG